MPIKTEFDYIIVGQGLAGSCLALQLKERGRRILTFDLPQENRASAVAAGLFNPITGKVLKQTWMADSLFPYLIDFYRAAERQLSSQFFFQAPIYRPFLSVAEQNEWTARSAEPGIAKYLAAVHQQSAFSEVHDPLGGVLTNYSGYLDVNEFMRAVADAMNKEGARREESFDTSQLTVGNDHVTYQGITAGSVIFCDGIRSLRHSFFSWAPIRPLKGETLSVTLAEVPGVIFNRGVYLVPTREMNSFVAGATYQPGDVSEGTTEGSRTELELKLSELLAIPFKTNHQNWGIRPTTPDRRPILGSHPEHKKVIIFNGLGTKGVSLAPYFSKVLAGWLEDGAELPFEVNIERFKSLYSKFSSANL